MHHNKSRICFVVLQAILSMASSEFHLNSGKQTPTNRLEPPCKNELRPNRHFCHPLHSVAKEEPGPPAIASRSALITSSKRFLQRQWFYAFGKSVVNDIFWMCFAGLCLARLLRKMHLSRCLQAINGRLAASAVRVLGYQVS